MAKRKRKLKKKVKIFGVLFIFGVLLVGGFLLSNYSSLTPKKEEKSEFVKKKFGEYVKVDKDVKLYFKENEEFLEEGIVSKNVVLHIEDAEDKYFKVLGLDRDYYVFGDNLSNYEEKISYDDRYKNYIVFNSNIKTKDKTLFYNEDGDLVYTINEGYSLPIIIKDTDKYGVEYANQLLYIKKDDGEVIDNHNTDKKNISGIATLNYHAFYDINDVEEKKACNSEICHSSAQFKSQLDYIKENNILTLKMKEVEMYIDGKIQLPKSVLLTIDDGGRTKVAVDILTEYKMYATIFLITSWFDASNYYVTDYIELHSHSHNLHDTGVCPIGQGGGIQCLDESVLQEDLKKTREMLNNTTYFCYPFYEYNNYSIEQLKKAGFTMAFVGESSRSDNLIKVGMDKFRLPRFVIVTYTTLNDLKNYFNGMK